MKQTPIFGLVGGFGIDAGIYYYERLARRYAGSDTRLRLVMVHGDVRKGMGHVTAGELDELAQYLGSLIAQLAAAGAEIAAIPAVTPHIVIDRVARAAPIPLVNILEVLAADLQRRSMRRIALFGTRFVIESDLYGALPPEIQAVRPNAEELARIDELYRALAMNGEAGAQVREAFTEIANTLCAREHLDAVVLAGTDLSALFENEQPEFPFVDASEVHLAAIVQRLSAD